MIFCYKVEETDDLNEGEKLSALNVGLDAINKLRKAEGLPLKDILPRGFEALNNLIEKYSRNKNSETVKKPRVKVSQKNRALLQKEINSKCPFCPSEDVGHFEPHHIDGDRSKSELTNLLLVCPTCHSKIEKGDITRE